MPCISAVFRREQKRRPSALPLSAVGSDLVCNCDMGGRVIRKVVRKGSSRWKRDRRVRYNSRFATMLHNNIAVVPRWPCSPLQCPSEPVYPAPEGSFEQIGAPALRIGRLNRSEACCSRTAHIHPSSFTRPTLRPTRQWFWKVQAAQL